VTAVKSYVIGIVAVTVLAVAMVLWSDAGVRTQVGWGVGVGLVVQAPLGWLAVQSIGTDRFMVIWGLGLMVRLAVLAIAGLAVVPLLGWSPGPALGAMVIVLVALLFVEGITAWQEHSGQDGSR